MKQLLYYPDTQRVQYYTHSGVVNIERGGYFMAKEDVTVYPLEAVLGVLRTATAEYLLFVSEGERCGRISDRGEDRELYRIRKSTAVAIKGREGEDGTAVCDFIDENGFYYFLESPGDTEEDEFVWNSALRRIFNEYETNKESIAAASQVPGRFCDTGEQSTNAPGRTGPYTPQPGARKRKLEDVIRSASSVLHPAGPAGSLRSGLGLSRSMGGVPVITHSMAATIDYMLATMLCGFYESRTHEDGGTAYEFRIHSRISTRKIGPRLLSRGIAPDGAVSFFVETAFDTIKKVAPDGVAVPERIRLLRGSIPYKWSQNDPLRPHKLTIEGAPEESRQACHKHFEQMEKTYGAVISVDLLGRRKDEKMLSDLYKDYCLVNKRPYIHFDVNAHVRDFSSLVRKFYARLEKTVGGWYGLAERGRSAESTSSGDSSSKDEEDVDEMSQVSSMTAPSSPGPVYDALGTVEPEGPIKKFLRDRGIVFRVNCLDCLDRTNLAQFLLFRYMASPWPQGADRAIKDMWRGNGNALSNFYTGSDALKSDLAVKGKRSMLGRMNDILISANRMINNKFTDKEKQRVMDLLLGRYLGFL